MVKKKNKKLETKVENIEEENVSKRLVKKENKQLIWFFGIIAFVFLTFLGTYFYVQSLKNFDYDGLSWHKTKFDQIEIYYTQLPIIYKGHHYLNYNLYFRNDPRENDVPVEIDSLSIYPEIIRAVDPSAWECAGTKKAYGDLEGFLASFPYVTKVTGAYTDIAEAERMGEAFADCSNATDKTVIVFAKSETPSIVQDKDSPDCYRLNIGDCEGVKVEEKFVLEFIKQLKIEKIE